MKNLISHIFKLSGLSHETLSKLAQKNFFVVNYHRVCPDSDNPLRFPSFFDLRTEPQLFARHLQFFSEYFDVVAYPDIFSTKTSKPKLLITFDDGYRDNFTHAFELLKKFGMPALFFIASGILEQKKLLWDNQYFYSLNQAGLQKTAAFFSKVMPSDDLAGLNENELSRKVFHYLTHTLNNHAARMALVLEFAESTATQPPADFVDHFYLSKAHIRTMQASGMYFGAHTHHHALLPFSTESEVTAELASSKEKLRALLNTNDIPFCYPSGLFDPRTRDKAAQLFSCAFTTRSEPQAFDGDRFLINRFHVSNQSVDYLLFEMSGWKKKLKEILQK